MSDHNSVSPCPPPYSPLSNAEDSVHQLHQRWKPDSRWRADPSLGSAPPGPHLERWVWFRTIRERWGAAEPEETAQGGVVSAYKYLKGRYKEATGACWSTGGSPQTPGNTASLYRPPEGLWSLVPPDSVASACLTKRENEDEDEAEEGDSVFSLQSKLNSRMVLQRSCTSERRKFQQDGMLALGRAE